MKKTTQTVSAAAILSVALLLTACSTGDDGSTGDAGSGSGTDAVAWSFASRDVDIWNTQLELMEPIIEEAGYEFLTNDPAFEVQTQVSDWESWIARGNVLAIGGFPVDAAAMNAVTASATDAGIPVISYAVEWDGVTATVEISNYDAGFAVGEAAGEWISETQGDSTVSVALLADTSTALGQDQLQGLKDGLASTDASISEYELEASTRDIAYTAAQSQLTADPDTSVWLGIGADMVLGARQAVIDSGVAADDENYYVSATDANAEALDLIESGEDMWKTAFAWKAADLAQANADFLIQAAEGETPENVSVGVTQVTADNTDEFRIESE